MAASVVVFDVGSSSTKIGFQHSTTPTILPTETRNSDGTIKTVIDGYIRSWNGLEEIFRDGYHHLQVNPENHRVVLANPYYPCPKAESEKMVQIFFEDFNVPALHLSDQPVLSLYSHGCLSGLTVHSGFKETQCYPIYEGHILLYPMMRGLPIAGEYLTNSLKELLEKKGYKCDYKDANEIKEKSLYVSEDFVNETPSEETFHLPDGTSITLSKEKIRITEELFTSFNELAILPDLVWSTTSRCDPELKDYLFNNIILSGGNTLFPNFPERLEKEMKQLLPSKPIRVIAPKNRGNSPWIGGTILASLPSFSDMYMTREEYDEWGPGLIKRKFF